MIVNIETVFEIDFDRFIEYLNRPRILIHVAKPLLTFTPVDFERFPKRWEEKEYQVKLKVLGIIPFGKHAIVVERVKKESLNEYILRDNGYGNIVKRWDHWVLVKKNDNKVQYIDRIDIKAGFLTFGVFLFANIFYRWRQNKWKNLIKNQFRNIENE